MHFVYGSLWHPNQPTHLLFIFLSNDSSCDDAHYDHCYSGEGRLMTGDVGFVDCNDFENCVGNSESRDDFGDDSGDMISMMTVREAIF